MPFQCIMGNVLLHGVRVRTHQISLSILSPLCYTIRKKEAPVKERAKKNIESFILELVGASFLMVYLFLTPFLAGSMMLALDLPHDLTLFVLIEVLLLLAPLFLWLLRRRRQSF